jgi:hypothetical protein
MTFSRIQTLAGVSALDGLLTVFVLFSGGFGVGGCITHGRVYAGHRVGA